MKTLIDLVRSLDGQGERPAVVAFGTEDATTWTYARLADAAGRIATGLTDRGVGPGDRVVVSADPSPVSIAAVLGILGSGATIMPVDVQHSGAHLECALETADVHLAFTTSDRAPTLAAARADSEVVLLEGDEGDVRHWSRQAAAEPRFAATDPSSEAAVFCTSGTTGTVKGVPLSHANITHQIDALVEAKLVGPGDTMLLPLPVHHVYPFVVGILLPLALGMPIVIPASLTGPDLIRALKEGEVTVVIGVPRLYGALLDGIEAKVSSRGAAARVWFKASTDLSDAIRRGFGVRVGKFLLAPVHREFGAWLDVVASGGAPLKPEIAWRLEAMGWRVAIGYGLTETSPILTLNPPGRARIGSVGQALRGVELRLDERADAPGEPAVGEVLARGPNVFAGYLGQEAQSPFTEDGWFRTGDLGSFDADGFLYLSGRASSLMVTDGGENVWPDELEEAYGQEAAIDELGVFERDGKILAVIVPARDAAGAPDEAVRSAVDTASRELPSYKRISEYAVSHDALERTRLGKVRRHLLAERYDQARSGEEPRRGPVAQGEMSEHDRHLLENPAAAEVWRWFAETYPDALLTMDASPRFDLGVDSLGWLSLTLAISERIGVAVDEPTIAGVETVRDLLEEVVRLQAVGGETAGSPLEVPERFLDERQLRALRPHGPLEAFLARGLVGLVRGLARSAYHLEVEGLENVPAEPPFLIAPNHTSFLDPFVVGAALGLERLTHVYWSGWIQAAFSNPIKRGVSRLARTIPIERDMGGVSSLALGAAVLGRGHALVWFPEGTRSPSGRLAPLKPGVGMLLDAYRVPAVPVTIYGTHEAWPVGRTLPRLGRVRVVFGEPIDPGELESRGEGETPAARITSGLQATMVEMARTHV